MSETRVLVLGCFDLFHPGHVLFLQAARKHGDHLTVALNSDKFSTRFKRPPIMSYGEREVVLLSCRHVDEVIENYGSEDARPAILSSGAKIVVHGDDWTGASYMQQLGVTRPWLQQNGVEIRYVSYTKGISTSEIVERCAQNKAQVMAYKASHCSKCGQPFGQGLSSVAFFDGNYMHMDCPRVG